MIQEAQTRWKELSQFELGELLMNAILCGCSIRGLAEMLPCSEATVRRLLDVADMEVYLTEEERAVIDRGVSVTHFLRRWSPEARRECHQERQPRFIERLHESGDKGPRLGRVDFIIRITK